MDKILFLNEKDRNTGLSLEHSDYRYKTTKPVAATKPKHDEVGFTIPYAMFRPIREPGLLCELLGDNPVRRTADLKMNFDFLVKDLYENEISRLMYVVRLEELRCRLIFSSEDRAWERYTRLREKGQQAAMPKVTSDESRKTLLKAITWKAIPTVEDSSGKVLGRKTVEAEREKALEKIAVVLEYKDRMRGGKQNGKTEYSGKSSAN